jgi:hypothetical protein
MTTFNRFFLSPLVTVILLLLVEYARRFDWYTPSTAIPLAGMLTCVFWSGLRANAISALFITAYTLTIFPDDPARSSQVIIFAWFVAIPCGLLKQQQIRDAVEAERNRHAAALVDAANGNLGTLKEIHTDTVSLVQGWQILSPEIRFRRVDEIRGRLANVLHIWEGWHILYKEREALKWENLSQKLRPEGS